VPYLCLSLEEVTVRAGHQVLMEVDNKSLSTVCDLDRILGKHLRPHPTCLLSIIIFIITTLINYLINKLYIIKLMTILLEVETEFPYLLERVCKLIDTKYFFFILLHIFN
jgi:hypothetical protein